MLKLFVEMTRPLIDRIQTAQAIKDYHDLKEAAHSLKGAARSACLNRLGDIAAQLQDDAEAQKAGALELVDTVVSAFNDAKAEIEKL